MILKRSFTLFEAIVAISVILTGLVSVMSLVRLSISTASIFQDRIIASNLAQEGIELVQNKALSNRKTLAYSDVCDPTAEVPCDSSSRGLSKTNDGLPDGPCKTGCFVNWASEADVANSSLTFNPCTAVCPELSFDDTTGLYLYDLSNSNFKKTNFTRTIIVQDISRTDGGFDEMEVISMVSWRSRFGQNQKVEFKTYLSPR